MVIRLFLIDLRVYFLTQTKHCLNIVQHRLFDADPDETYTSMPLEAQSRDIGYSLDYVLRPRQTGFLILTHRLAIDWKREQFIK